MSNTKIVSQATHLKVDMQTGEVLEMEQNTDTRTIVKQEPPYMKLYLADLTAIEHMPSSHTDVLYALAKRATYADNENPMCIALNSYIKQQICKECGWNNAKSLNNILTKLIKKDIIRRLGPSTYQLNPNLFGRGDWKDISKIRAIWDYTAAGRCLKTEITYNDGTVCKDGRMATQTAPEGPDIALMYLDAMAEEDAREAAREAAQIATVAFEDMDIRPQLEDAG